MYYRKKLGFFSLIIFLLFTACADNKSQVKQQEPTFSQETIPSRSPNEFRDASLNGRMEIVQEAIEQGIDVQIPDAYGRTALMLAAYNGYTNIVQYLIEQGAEVNNQNTEGRTALMFAATGPFPETVKLLLEENANVNSTDSVEGWTALMFAAAEGNKEVVEILLEYEADFSIEDDDGETAIDFAENNGHTVVVNLLKDQL